MPGFWFPGTVVARAPPTAPVRCCCRTRMLGSLDPFTIGTLNKQNVYFQLRQNQKINDKVHIMGVAFSSPSFRNKRESPIKVILHNDFKHNFECPNTTGCTVKLTNSFC